MAKKLLIFAIIYLIIGYIIMKKRCQNRMVVASQNPNILTNLPPKWMDNMEYFVNPNGYHPTSNMTINDAQKNCMSLGNILQAPIEELIAMFQSPKYPQSPPVVTGGDGSYWSQNGRCMKSVGGVVGIMPVDNNECTSRGIEIVQ